MAKILIVDDDTAVRSTLSRILRAQGYLIDEASSGREALEKSLSTDFDIILLDVVMPRMSGMDVLLELKKVKPKTKEIMITGFATIHNAIEAIKKGASDYISKPFNAEELDVAIRRCLEETEFNRSEKKLDLNFTFGSLSNPLRRIIMKLLYQNDTMHLMEITRALKIEDHTKVVFHLKVLRESSLIEQHGDKTYYLSREGEKTLSCLKIFENILL
jgi:YesN/AraC family two-component response regulator